MCVINGYIFNATFYTSAEKEYEYGNVPAVQAFIKDTTVPVTIALKAIPAMSDFLDGAIAPRAPITIPMELKFANPHKA